MLAITVRAAEQPFADEHKDGDFDEKYDHAESTYS